MSLAHSIAEKRPPDPERRAAILAAAERAFVRLGFHATSMQNVAEEAGMSAGNLYRYFPSKEAIVEAICSADETDRARDFAEIAQQGDFLGMAERTIRSKLLGKPRQKAQMILEIWAEAGRNPKIAAMAGALDAKVRAGIIGLVDTAQRRGEAASHVDPDFVARAIMSLVAGVFKRRALEAEFDIDAEAAMMVGLITALFAGVVRPHPQFPPSESP